MQDLESGPGVRATLMHLVCMILAGADIEVVRPGTFSFEHRSTGRAHGAW